jgi:hypothetical protein
MSLQQGNQSWDRRSNSRLGAGSTREREKVTRRNTYLQSKYDWKLFVDDGIPTRDLLHGKQARYNWANRVLSSIKMKINPTVLPAYTMQYLQSKYEFNFLSMMGFEPGSFCMASKCEVSRSRNKESTYLDTNESYVGACIVYRSSKTDGQFMLFVNPVSTIE